MKTRTSDKIRKDLDRLSPADRQQIQEIAYSLKSFDYTEFSKLSESEAAKVRLLRDIASGNPFGVRSIL